MKILKIEICLTITKVYEDWVHANAGTHLHGGIADDEAWKGWRNGLAVMPSRRYGVTSGKVGWRFDGDLVEELCIVRYRRWNLERFIILQTVILKRARNVTAFHAIQRRIEKRLDAGEVG